MAHPTPAANVWDLHPEFQGLPQDGITFEGRIRPLYLRIETVNHCNNDCIICAYGDQTRAKKHMPRAVFEKALDDYRNMGGGYVSLTPLVGDVLMDRHIRERIDYLQTCDFVSGIGFTTNAAMAHRFSDRELATIVGPLQRLSISIYGLDEGEYRGDGSPENLLAHARRRAPDRQCSASAGVWLDIPGCLSSGRRTSSERGCARKLG